MLGVVFVLLVCFLRRGIVGAIVDLVGRAVGRRRAAEPAATPRTEPAAASVSAEATPLRRSPTDGASGPILQATGLTKRYDGLVANNDIDFTVNHGEMRGIIGPNGAGKSTFFKMLTCEIPPTSGKIVLEGRDITGRSMTEICQLGLTKSYQINQLFDRLTVRRNLNIAALARIRGKFRLDLFRSPANVPGLGAGRPHSGARKSDRAAEHSGVGACLRREATAGDRTGAGDIAEPAPARRAARGSSPRERVETGALFKFIARDRTMIIIDHDVDFLFELVEKVTVLQEGRVLVEGSPDEVKTNAKVQEAYLGGIHGVAA